MRVLFMYDFLRPDGPRFKMQNGVFKLGTDAVLLSQFAASKYGEKTLRAADLGCGAGVIGIILAWENPGLIIDLFDISPDAAELAAYNIKLNSLEDRAAAICGDLRDKQLLKAGFYDLVISNPPYYAFGSGKLHSDALIAAARSEHSFSLEELCCAAGYSTRWGGSFFMVHKAERLADIFRCLGAFGFEPKRVRFVFYRADLPANLVLVEARRGGKPGLTVSAPLILTNSDGGDTDEVRAIYQR